MTYVSKMAIDYRRVYMEMSKSTRVKGKKGNTYVVRKLRKLLSEL